MLSLVSGGPVQLQYEVTRTDGDGDTVTQSATVDLIGTQGSGISFEDDAPTAGLTVQAGATVVVDESIGQNAGETEGGAAGLGQVTVLGTTLFGASPVTGQDNEGATVAFSLSVVGGGVTGLFSTDNQAITLFNNAGTIEGRYGAGIVAFTLTIDALTGNVTLTQLQSLRHPTGGLASPDEAVSLATGALQAVLTVTDGDGDIATSAADLGGGVIRFEDDAPIAVAGTSTGTVDEDGLPNGIEGGPGDVDPGAGAGIERRARFGAVPVGADVPLSFGFNTAGTLPQVCFRAALR